MQINSICFHPKTHQVGGGQVPAYAFSTWCRILEVRCGVSYGIDNDCDWMFLSTPGIMKTDYIQEIEKPFAMMIHAEFDKDLYPALDKLLDHEMCKLVVVIGEQYWGFTKPQLYWHPCTLPQYLMKEDTTFDNSNRYGLLYAARISSWKGINKLAALSEYDHFFSEVDGRIDVYGKQSSDFVIEPGRYTFKDEAYSIYDFDTMGQLYRQYRYIWDVSGSPTYELEIKRLNLAAVEAMKFGCIPIAGGDSAYPFARKWIVDLNRGFPSDYLGSQQRMKEQVLQSPICYDAVQKQVENIINHMEQYCD